MSQTPPVDIICWFRTVICSMYHTIQVYMHKNYDKITIFDFDYINNKPPYFRSSAPGGRGGPKIWVFVIILGYVQ